MSVFDTFRELRKSKKYEWATNSCMVGNNCSETYPIISVHESNKDTESKTRILTQKEVGEQIRSYIAPLTRQLEDLTCLIHGMLTAHRPNLSPRAGTSTSSSAAGPSPGKGLRNRSVKMLLERCIQCELHRIKKTEYCNSGLKLLNCKITKTVNVPNLLLKTVFSQYFYKKRPPRYIIINEI